MRRPIPTTRTGCGLAELFLVEIEVRGLILSARLGLSWGYYLQSGRPFALPIQPITLHLWRLHTNQLRREYPQWTFA